MASTVIAAAVNVKRNVQSNILAPILMNPAKTHLMSDADGRNGEQSTRNTSGGGMGSGLGSYVPDYGSVSNTTGVGRRNPSGNTQLPTTGDREDAETDDDDYEPSFSLTTVSYRRLIQLYALVPFTAILTIVFFILLRHFLWSPRDETLSFSLQLGLAILGAATWAVSFGLRVPIYLLSSTLPYIISTWVPFLSASMQVFIEECLRLASLVLIHMQLSGSLNPSDPAFARVWIMALGWAAAEVTISIFQGYGQLFLYHDLIEPDPASLRNKRPTNAWALEEPGTAQVRYIEDPETVLDKEIDQIIRIRARAELEALYGISVPEIPVFVSCLLRVDSITLSVALFLVISSSYLSHLPQSSPMQSDISHAIWNTIPVFLAIFVLRTLISFCWTLSILPRIGLHAASYMSCIFALGFLFVGLGRWDAI